MRKKRRLKSGGSSLLKSTVYKRKINPDDIQLPNRYHVDAFADGLETPISMLFTPGGEMLVADSGINTGNGKVLRYTSRGFHVISEGFNPPLTGICCFDESIYVSHRGSITAIRPDGTKQDIISGLPSLGDHHNNQVAFGSDGKMYFGQGTATNSGVVGPDNEWVAQHPFFHDYPGTDIYLNGQNFSSPNINAPISNEYISTGAYSPFGVRTFLQEMIGGITRTSGSILRANPDGSNLQQVAWGLRNPFRIKFDRFDRLFSTNQGAAPRGVRPISNSPDEFQLIIYGAWYGWPDYAGGMPVTLPQFSTRGYPQPEFLISSHPMVPPKPFVLFPPYSGIMGFDFNYCADFGPYGDAYIAELGSGSPETTGGRILPGTGCRISKINMNTGQVSIFAINKSGRAASHTNGGGFENPVDVVFGPDNSMYVLDFGVPSQQDPRTFYPNSGMIWRITGRSGL